MKEELILFCIKNGINIVTMESCTGGGLVNELTNVSGSSSVIKDSFVTYSNKSKIKLGIKKEIIDEYSVYSKEVAIQMSCAVISNSVSNYKNLFGIGVTGSFSRIDPNNQKNSILGVVYFAFTYNDSLYSEKIVLDSNLTRVDSKKKVIAYIIKKSFEFLNNKN